MFGTLSDPDGANNTAVSTLSCQSKPPASDAYCGMYLGLQALWSNGRTVAEPEPHHRGSNIAPILTRARGANCLFARLKAQGARFPDARDATPVFTPTAESYGASASGGGLGGGGGGGGGRGVAETTPQTMEKLEEDLQVRPPLD